MVGHAELVAGARAASSSIGPSPQISRRKRGSRSRSRPARRRAAAGSSRSRAGRRSARVSSPFQRAVGGVAAGRRSRSSRRATPRSSAGAARRGSCAASSGPTTTVGAAARQQPVGALEHVARRRCTSACRGGGCARRAGSPGARRGRRACGAAPPARRRRGERVRAEQPDDVDVVEDAPEAPAASRASPAARARAAACSGRRAAARSRSSSGHAVVGARRPRGSSRPNRTVCSAARGQPRDEGEERALGVDAVAVAAVAVVGVDGERSGRCAAHASVRRRGGERPQRRAEAQRSPPGSRRPRPGAWSPKTGGKRGGVGDAASARRVSARRPRHRDAHAAAHAERRPRRGRAGAGRRSGRTRAASERQRGGREQVRAAHALGVVRRGSWRGRSRSASTGGRAPSGSRAGCSAAPSSGMQTIRPPRSRNRAASSESWSLGQSSSQPPCASSVERAPDAGEAAVDLDLLARRPAGSCAPPVPSRVAARAPPGATRGRRRAAICGPLTWSTSPRRSRSTPRGEVVGRVLRVGVHARDEVAARVREADVERRRACCARGLSRTRMRWSSRCQLAQDRVGAVLGAPSMKRNSISPSKRCASIAVRGLADVLLLVEDGREHADVDASRRVTALRASGRRARRSRRG